ncbi:hypothetical protein BSM4216_2219 [Bacillus smithii]|nr:hypothetical protein BSM4216_2219 [Bacillus smithii]
MKTAGHWKNFIGITEKCKKGGHPPFLDVEIRPGGQYAKNHFHVKEYTGRRMILSYRRIFLYLMKEKYFPNALKPLQVDGGVF